MLNDSEERLTCGIYGRKIKNIQAIAMVKGKLNNIVRLLLSGMHQLP